MKMGDFLRAIGSAALLALAANTASADTITAEHNGRTYSVEGEVIEENDEFVVVKNKSGKFKISKNKIKTWEKETPEKEPEPEPIFYYRLNDVLLGGNDILPELTLEDLQNITGYPELKVEKQGYAIRLVPGTQTPAGQTTTNRFVSYGNGRKASFVKGKRFNVQLAKFEYTPVSFSIKHPSNEKIDGIQFPKDLVFVSSRNPRGGIHRIERFGRNLVYTNSHEFPKIQNQIVGRFYFEDKEYIVLDTYLFSKEKYGKVRGLPDRYWDFPYGEIDLWREYFNLRGESDEYVEEFNALEGKLRKTQVRLGGKSYQYVHYDDEEVQDIAAQLSKIEQATGKGVNKKRFADYLVSADSETLDKMLEETETLEDVISTLNSFFAGRTVNGKVDGWQVPLEKLTQYKVHDCDTGGKVALHAFRKKGFPANFVFAYTKPISRTSAGTWHAWVEVYLPKQDLIVTYDVNNSDRNYIFRPDSREKMDYVFDRKASRSGIILQIPLNKAFDLE
jgi:hypothetical protein